jgi:hypothetical protein
MENGICGIPPFSPCEKISDARKIGLLMIFTPFLFYGQKDTQSIFTPTQVYDKDVRDCFKNPYYSGKVMKDSVAPNYVMMGQRIWRTISLENKENENTFSKAPGCKQLGLFEVMKFGLFEKGLHAFSSDDFSDVTKTIVGLDQLKKDLSINDTIVENSYDAGGNESAKTRIEKRYFLGRDVKVFVLKEDWFINAYGVTERRIVGIAPLVYDKKTGMMLPLFWLYYNEWKELFNSFEAKSYSADALVSYRTVLERNYFISQISKESNLFDRSIKSYKHGKDPGIESEIIKEKINNSERDIFQY